MKIDCAALQAELDQAKLDLTAMRAKSGVQMIRDSDGSQIQYSANGLNTQQAYVSRLEAMICVMCPHCGGGSSGPIGYVFP
jgi:hypothetical protein